MRLVLIVGFGSFLGGILRYLLAMAIHSRFSTAFPLGTLGVNLIGCFAIGLVFGLTERGNLPSEWRLFFATGVCGGFTTFSSFSNETLSLLRDGQHLYAALYILLSVTIGLASTFAGYAVARMV